LEKIEKIMGETGLNFSEVVRKSLKPVISLSKKVNLNQYNFEINTESIFQVKQQLKIMEEHSYNHLTAELQILKNNLKEITDNLSQASHIIHSNTMRSQSIVNETADQVRSLQDKINSLIDLIEKMKRSE